jgi:cellulose synthase/poly-beta-1,6-N-acetylglucosamine synthase-like glycosyltransferase
MSATRFAEIVLTDLAWGILAYFALVNSWYAVLLAAAARDLRGYAHRIRGAERWRLLGSTATPRISILAPAFNEEASVQESVRGLLAIAYPNLEVVIVNDGSRDATLEILMREFELLSVQAAAGATIETQPVRQVYRSRTHGNLIVVDKQNGGKADAMNAALNIASGTLVCAVDVDTLIEGDALQRVVQPFIEHDDTLAAGGTVRVANGCDIQHGRVVLVRAQRNALAGIQAVEYLRAFLFGRLGWNRLGGNLIISGAFGLFRRDAVVAVGGWLAETVGEDMELVLRLRRRAYESDTSQRITFVPDPVAWTEVPEARGVLARQRVRWHRGLADTLWRHRRVLFNPHYGAMGLVTYPYFLFVELLAPVVELTGLLATVVGFCLGLLDLRFAILFFLVAYGYGVVLTLASLLLEELSFRRYTTISDRLLLVWWALIENLGYRQRTVVWRIRGLVNFLRGNKEWGAMERRGLSRPAAARQP